MGLEELETASHPKEALRIACLGIDPHRRAMMLPRCSCQLKDRY